MRTIAILVVLCFLQCFSAFLHGATGGEEGMPPFDTRSPQQLLQVIQDHERKWEERRDCATALADHPKYDNRAILPLLKSADAEVRMLGAIALRGGAEAAVPELLRVLQKDPNGSVQFFAALSLGKIGDRRAVPVLIRFADAGDTHYRAREGVVSALAEISDPRAIDVLVRIVKTEIYRTNNKVGPWREALNGLCKLGNAKAVETLGEAATKCPDQFVRGNASSLLRKLENPDGLEQLALLALENKNLSVRYHAIQGVGNFHSDRAVAILSMAYRQEPSRNTLLSMGKTGHDDTIPILLGVMLDNETKREFRYYAASALTLVGQSAVPSLLREWAKVKGDSRIFKDRDARVLLTTMSGIADSRLLPVWKEVFNMTAPTARKSRWGMHRLPQWEFLLGRFDAGMVKIGKDALPYIEELHQQEQHDLLCKQLADLIERINYKINHKKNSKAKE